MILGAFTGLKALIERFLLLFRNAEPGFAIDFGDLTDEKLKWRRNLFQETEFRNGNSDIPQRIANFQVVQGVTDMLDFKSACSVTLDSATMAYAVRNSTHIVGRVYTISAFFKMSDGLRPVLTGYFGGATSDFALVINNSAISSDQLVITDMGNGVYRVSGSLVATNVTSSSGVYKYAGNSSKAFRFTGWQLELGALTAYQKITDVTTQFMAAFPKHTLYQDNKGQLPTHSLEQQIGYALDTRYQGARGPNLITNGTFDTDLTGWTGGLANGTNANASISWVNGKMRITNADTTSYYRGTQRLTNLVVGRTYEVEAWVTVISGTPTTNRMTITGVVDWDLTGVPDYIRGIFVATSTTHDLSLGPQQTGSSVAVVTEVDNVSLREIYGKHAIPPAVVARPVLSGRVNLLIETEGVSKWASNSPSVVSVGAFAPYNGVRVYDGSVTGDSPNFQGVTNSIPAGSTVTYSCLVNTNTLVGTGFRMNVLAADADGWQRIRYDVAPPWTTLTFQPLTSNVSNVSGTFKHLGGGIYLATITGTYAKVCTPRLYPNAYGPSAPAVTLGCLQAEFGPVFTRYQRVESATSYDVNGFVRGAKFNGGNNYIGVTGVDLTALNKLVAFGLIRKDSDAARACVIGTGSVLAGTFAVEAPSTTLNNVMVRSGANNAISTKNDAVRYALTSFVAQVGLGEGSALFVDGVALPVTANNETDKFIATTVWIGGFNNSQFFNGLIVRIGLRGGATDTILNSYARRWAGYVPPMS